jgi:hypothetical protein
MCTRFLARIFAVCFAFCFTVAGQSQTMSVDKLIAFIQSSAKFIQEKKMTDNELAGYLAKVKLTERLEDRTIEDMQSAGGLGPKTMLALKLLRDRTQSLSAANLTPAPKYVPPPPPSSAEQGAIVTEVREYALNYSKGLPNFLCTEVTRRKAANAPGSRYGGGPANQPSYQSMDTLTIRLSYYEQKEDYKLILINNAPTTQDYRSVGGATSTGEFGSMLRQIFEPATEARFEWDHWGLLRGRRVMAFAYHVEQSRSQWEIEYQQKEHIIPAYSGLVEVDQDTHVVMRVTLVAENIPPSFPIKHAETILDYDYTDISGHEFLLPLKSETRMTSDGILSKNETEFRFYRKYSAEAEIKYDITPDPLPDDKTKEVKDTVNCKDPKNAKDPRCKH